MIGVAPHVAEGPIPDWTISITKGPSEYTPALFVDAPEGTTLKLRQTDEDGR